MDHTQYRETVVENGRKHGFEPVSENTNGFDLVWQVRDEDDSIGAVTVLATLVDGDSTWTRTTSSRPPTRSATSPPTTSTTETSR